MKLAVAIEQTSIWWAGYRAPEDRKSYGGYMRARSEARVDPSFEAFYETQFDRVLRTASLVTRDFAVAEEVTQEAFAKAYASWWRVSRYELPDAWVRKVAMRMAMRQVQRRKTFDALVQRMPAPETTSVHQDQGRVSMLIAQLPPGQRVAIVLHYLEDRPISEIAEIMDCSPSTVKVHLHRARRKLADLLGAEHDDA